MKYKAILIFIVSISVLIRYNNWLNATQELNNLNSATKKFTIFIHGTRMIRYFPLNLSSNMKVFDTLLSTPHLGLHHYSSVNEPNNQIKIAKTLHAADPTMFPLDTFYFFGWSGKLSVTERRIEAKKLAHEIDTIIIKPFKEKYGIDPEITIITHSHGGNIALNLGREKNSSLIIDALIMLACPVQHETKKYINNSVFKTIYSFYSDNDSLQVLDPQFLGSIGHGVIKAFIKKSTKPLKKIWQKMKWPFLSSSRKFTEKTSLYQIKMGWEDTSEWSESDLDIYGPLHYLGKKMTLLWKKKRRGFYHIEFLMPRFFKELPVILKKISNEKTDFTFFIA